MKLVFFGTPEFAVPSLEAIHDSKHELTGVVTIPDKKSGRGLKVQSSPVKKVAEKLGYPILQPIILDDKNFVNKIKQIQTDIYVVVAFRILPELIINIPEKGAVNLHASILPKYRGAAPVNHAILNGDTETGLTTFIIRKEVDTGDILLQEKFKLEQSMTAGVALRELSFVGAKLLIDTLDALDSGRVSPIEQNNNIASKAPKIKTDDYKINWHSPAEKIHNLIRAFSPYPGAFTFFNNKRVKLFNSEVNNKSDLYYLSPGEIQYQAPFLLVGTADKTIKISEIQMEGKNRLPVKIFILGNNKMKGSYFDKA